MAAQIPQTISVGPWGGDGGDSWDDRVNAGIRQIKLKMEGDWIRSINIEYDSNGVSFWSKHGGKGAVNKTYAIELDYPKERITSINGHYSVKPDTVKPKPAKPDSGKPDTAKPDTYVKSLTPAKPDSGKPDTYYVKSLTFKSNLKKIYGPCGVEDGTYFSFSMAEGKIVGFHGRSKDYLNCIGVHISNLQAPTILKNLVGPWGGKGGNSWDDGVNDCIRQIILAHGSLIDSIKIGYQRTRVWDGVLDRPLVWSKHGGSGGNNVDKIELSNKDKERITSISGYYDTYVRSLTFESNLKKIYGPYGVEDGTYFSFSMAKGEIVGFRGQSGWYLDCIGVIPKSLKHTLFDTPPGGLWDDGVYSGIHQIIVVYNEDVIDSIHIEYDNNGSPFWLERGGSTVIKTEKSDDKKILRTGKIRLDYPKEILTSISGRYHPSEYYLSSLAFESNLKKYGPYGSTRGTDFESPKSDCKIVGEFEFPKSDCKIVGFYGRSRSYDLQGRRGSYFFGLGVSLSPFPAQSVPISVGPWGNVKGTSGCEWDDGMYSGIHQIIVVYDEVAIVSIHIQYDNNGSPFWPDHGESNGNKIGKIQLDYPTEILTSISGRYDTDGIKSLTFESNLKKHGPFGIQQGNNLSVPFSIPTRDGKIVGFYGWSDECLLYLGVNLSHLHTAVPLKPISVGPWGGEGGDTWDDVVCSGIQQIEVYYDEDAIRSIRIQYDNNGSPIWLNHGGSGKEHKEITLGYPEEILISVSGCYDTYLKSLTFESNLKNTYGPYGPGGGTTHFSFPIRIGKIVSFHGRSNEYLYSIGVYLSNGYTALPPKGNLPEDATIEGGSSSESIGGGGSRAREEEEERKEEKEAEGGP